MTLNRNHICRMYGHMTTVLIITTVAIYLAVISFVNLKGFCQICNSDVYADMQVAKRMWEQKTLFPEGWGFGNQYYVIATPVLAALLYGLLGNINTAMLCATVIMSILIFVSFTWLLLAFTKDFQTIIFAWLLLLTVNISELGPYSLRSMLFFQQASFYACYLITAFVVFGDYIRVIQDGQNRPLSLFLSLLLCFATGMQSLRQTVVMVLPIVACEFFQILRCWIQNRSIAGLRYSGKRLIRVSSYGVANLVGILTIRALNVPQTTVYGQMKLNSLDQLNQQLHQVKDAIFDITGIDVIQRHVLGKTPRMLYAALIVIALIAFLRWIWRIKIQETGPEICWMLCLLGGGVCLSAIVFHITIRGIYLFMWFPFVVFSAIILIRHMPSLLRNSIIIILCLLCASSIYSVYTRYIQKAVSNAEADAQELCQWALDNDYTYVYGDYWSTAPSVAVWSEGKLEAGCWHTAQNVFLVEKVVTPQDIYTEADNEKAIYVFTDTDESEGLAEARKRGIVMKKVAQFGEYCAYTSPTQLMRIQTS